MKRLIVAINGLFVLAGVLFVGSFFADHASAGDLQNTMKRSSHHYRHHKRHHRHHHSKTNHKTGNANR